MPINPKVQYVQKIWPVLNLIRHVNDTVVIKNFIIP